jgi:hypothetical protein
MESLDKTRDQNLPNPRIYCFQIHGTDFMILKKYVHEFEIGGCEIKNAMGRGVWNLSKPRPFNFALWVFPRMEEVARTFRMYPLSFFILFFVIS